MTTETKSKPVARQPRKEQAAKSAVTISRREAELLYPIYVALAREFSLGEPPCPESQAAAALAVPASAQKILRWILQLDQRVQVGQVRYLLQTTKLSTEERLRILIQWHLRKSNRTSLEREKIDFLCTQYFVLCASPEVLGSSVSFAAVAGVLRPVLGATPAEIPNWLQPLEAIDEALQQCPSLRDLLEGGYLEQGRELKTSSEEHFYEPATLAAFARFNFLLRRSFIRLMHADLRAIRAALLRLHQLGVTVVDCHRAGLSAEEPIGALLERCEKWKQPFRTEYTETKAGQVFGLLLAIRADVEEALRRIEQEASPSGASEEMEITVEEDLDAWGEAQAPAVNAAPPPEVFKPPVTAPAPKPPIPPPAAPVNAVPAPTIDAEECLEKIWEQLIAAPPARGRTTNTVTCYGSRVLLSSWEVAAFVSESGPTSEDLRNGVVARALVTVALEYFKKSNENGPLNAAIAVARKVAVHIQEQADKAKRAKDTEGAVNLGITAKRLRTTIEEAEKR